MANLFPNLSQGAATLVTALILLVTSTLIVIFAANNGRLQTDIAANITRSGQAYSAAQAGVQFAINYLANNTSTITANPSNGYINYSDANTTNVTLANNSKFSVTYTNPTANDYSLIRITSSGLSDDNSSTRTIQMDVKRGSLFTIPNTTTLVSKGAINISGNGSIINTVSNQTITSASSITFSGNGNTLTSSGLSSSAATGTQSDVQQNDSTLSNMSTDSFFANYFGTTSTTTVQAQATTQYNNNVSTNYSSSLNGLTGQLIWLNQTNGSTASISGNTTIGSINNPVILVVNGNLSITGNVTLYGYIFVIGSTGITTSLSGNLTITGGVATTGDTNISGNTNITYSTTVANNIQNNSALSYWAPVPGSWKDF